MHADILMRRVYEHEERVHWTKIKIEAQEHLITKGDCKHFTMFLKIIKYYYTKYNHPKSI